MRGTTDEYWIETAYIIRLLKNIIPEHLVSSGRVAIAGSSPLFWWQQMNRKGPDWRKNVPFDVDVFACLPDDQFIGLVNSLQSSIPLSRFDTFKARYILKDRDLMICNIILNDVVPIEDAPDLLLPSRCITEISIVQSPQPNVVATISRFDINVCKVLYDFFSESFLLADASVANSITSGVAFMTLGYNPASEPSNDNYDKKRRHSAMIRRDKYQNRGFSIVTLIT